MYQPRLLRLTVVVYILKFVMYDAKLMRVMVYCHGHLVGHRHVVSRISCCPWVGPGPIVILILIIITLREAISISREIDKTGDWGLCLTRTSPAQKKISVYKSRCSFEWVTILAILTVAILVVGCAIFHHKNCSSRETWPSTFVRNVANKLVSR